MLGVLEMWDASYTVVGRFAMSNQLKFLVSLCMPHSEKISNCGMIDGFIRK